MIHRRAGTLALALAVSGCHAAPPPASATRQPYRAVLTTPRGDDIPFFLELPSNCTVAGAAVINGPERIAVPCQRHGSHVVIDFAVYGTRVTATSGDAGSLAGYWNHTGGGIADARHRFRAWPLERLDGAERFERPADPAAAPPEAKVAGVWRLEFESHELGKARFETSGSGVVSGTAEIPSEYGDLRFLAGNVHGSSLRASTFDGGSAYLIKGAIDSTERMRGELIRGDGSRVTFTATRSADFDVVDPLQRVRVTSVERRFDWWPLLNSRYAGKAVIVELFGTWCSNCNDLAPLLVDLYRRHHDDGLEILSVAYEISEDEAYRRERVEAYRAQHGVGWEVVMPNDPPEALLSAGPAAISPIGGVPVTLFLNRDRTIRAIYAGFWGPATKPSHEKAIATFHRLTAEILSSPAPRSRAPGTSRRPNGS